MLNHLSIQNYALIDNLEIDIAEGLTIITGETGAGKSILLGALSLLVGSRADAGTLRDKNKKCIVEAQFSINKYKLISFFERHGLDYADLSTIRREINPAGISRAFINDTPVNLSQLKEIGASLIDIHSQHQNISLNEAAFQISLLDVFAKHREKLTDYQSNFFKYKKLKQELEELVEMEEKSKKDLDYFQFQFNELEQVNLKAFNLLALEQESETLAHAETIKKALNTAAYAINHSDQNILRSMSDIKNTLQGISKYNTSLTEITERVNSMYIEAKDVLTELENLEQEIVFNPERLLEIDEKLNLIYHLQKKHRVESIEQLLAIQEELSQKIFQIGNLDDKIDTLKKGIQKLETNLADLSETISLKRKSASATMEKELRKLLSDLGMPNANLLINVLPAADFNELGRDKIQFLFSANKGSDAKELSKVASGGELSRLLLSLKSLLAKSSALPTILFDEIDTGVSGEVANKMGIILEKMAGQMQVISITHLPQIASKGKEHLYVFKEEMKDSTSTKIKKLNKEERIQEIAQMLSSKTPTAAAINNAKDLLSA